MREQLYGLRMPALEAATVTVRVVHPPRRTYLRGSPLTPAAEALSRYVVDRCRRIGTDGVPGSDAARFLQRWAVPAESPGRAELGWGLLWDISRARSYGIRTTVGQGAPWPSVRDPHAAPSRAYA
ncbi:hypothetical protein ACH437_03770 [Streptomyces xinghaiensis]|uniref:hypothetical protein n=1 Tax=Streptomyces xinghaiensis TaxID=1038928 RepID=UPI0037997AFD